METAWYIHRNKHGIVTAVMHSHVDDILVACNMKDLETVKAIGEIKQKLHMTMKTGNVSRTVGSASHRPPRLSPSTSGQPQPR